ncbi:hypothetical protein [Sinorhizobium meliloti]|uniref:hypothetical protein n=1 Tax=Rhizobium meliloti TaxID=382 RepID=UPI0018656CDC|nr:hypothetical protein [Sinorhizobium meliloti]
MALKLWPVLSARRAVRTRLPSASVRAGEDCNLLLNSVLVTEMRAAPRPWRGEEFFQPNDLGWLDSCDEHRNEEIKPAAAGIPNFSRIRRVLLRQIAITNFINPC